MNARGRFNSINRLFLTIALGRGHGEPLFTIQQATLDSKPSLSNKALSKRN